MAQKAVVILATIILVATVGFAVEHLGWLPSYARSWDEGIFTDAFALHAGFMPVEPAWEKSCRDRYLELKLELEQPERLIP